MQDGELGFAWGQEGGGRRREGGTFVNSSGQDVLWERRKLAILE